MTAEIGIIGGSGLYSMPGFEAQEEAHRRDPVRRAVGQLCRGQTCRPEVAFLARHGRGHRISPSELNFRANICGMKSLGVERILSLSAVGSLKEEHRPLDFVIPDQFFDRTRGRVSTFFGEGLVAHISFADPVCPQLAVVEQPARDAGVNAKQGGTYLCMEGPAFSTKAESNVYRSWGMDVIGMTNLQEAKLAREAEICYVTIAMVTDYDCWHPEHDAVTVNDIIANLVKNAENACKVVAEAVARMPAERTCKCGSALAHALITDRTRSRSHAQETGSADWQILRVTRRPRELLDQCLRGDAVGSASCSSELLRDGCDEALFRVVAEGLSDRFDLDSAGSTTRSFAHALSAGSAADPPAYSRLPPRLRAFARYLGRRCRRYQRHPGRGQAAISRGGDLPCRSAQELRSSSPPTAASGTHPSPYRRGTHGRPDSASARIAGRRRCIRTRW